MGKLMRVTLGSAFLVAVDIRKGSPTLGEWVGIEASAENRRSVWAPVLSFHPSGSVRSIVDNLIDNMDKFRDWDNPAYSNIQTFKQIENGIEVHDMVGAA